MVHYRAAAAVLGLSLATAAAPCRDRWLQPFAPTSIWNTALGSDAVYAHAQIYTGAFNASWGCELRVSAANRRRACKAPGTNGSTPEAACVAAGCCFVAQPHAQCFVPAGGIPDAGVHADQDLVVRAIAGDPLTPFHDRAWAGGSECAAGGGAAVAALPFPSAYSVDCEDNNNAFALLLPDNETLLQSQPLYRVGGRGALMAQWPPTSPYPAFMAGWNISIMGDGALGSHGGSFLSAIGGTLRVGELSAGVIPHALKLEFFGHDYYWSGLTPPACFAWPAIACDGYATASGWNGYRGLYPWVRPGALLAVPPSLAPAVRANLTTAPAAVILTALATYGAYLVDDTAGDSAAICAEPAAIAELRDVWGISINITSSALPGSPGATGAFFADMVAIFRALHAVVNNAPGSVGGGGAPLAPPAPPLCE